MKNTIKLFSTLSLFALFFQGCSQQDTGFSPYKDDQTYTHFLIAADQTNSTLTSFGIRTKGAVGSLKETGSTVKADGGVYVVAATKNGDIILSAGSKGGIESFKIEPKTGKLSSVGETGRVMIKPDTVDHFATNLCFITIHPNNKFAYVTDGRTKADGTQADGIIHVLEIKPDGAISLIVSQKSSNLDWPMGIAIHPNGEYAYVANYAPKHPIDDRITGYKIDKNSGTLTELTTIPFSASNIQSPRNLTISDSGEHLYVVDELNNPTNITSFTIGTDDGLLTYKNHVVADSGSLGAAVAVDPKDRFGFFTSRATIETTPFNSPPPDTVFSFELNSETKSMQTINSMKTQGTQPVTVIAHPSEPYIYVGHQSSEHISAFSYDTFGELSHLFADETGERNTLTEDAMKLPGTKATSSFITIVTLEP